MVINVKQETILKTVVTNSLKGKSKNNIKSIFADGGVYLNNKIVTNPNTKVYPNNEVYVVSNYIKDTFFKMLEIIYEDKYLIVLNKPSGLLTIGTEKQKEKTLYHIVSSYLKQKNKNNKVFIVHRLDKDTSGIVILAKSVKVQKALQENWNNTVYREYLGVVHGKVTENLELKDYIAETKDHKSYITTKERGKLALTNIEVLKTYQDKTLLKIVILTGRKNQIRVQLAHINHPLLGDKKYGLKDGYKKMYLHASKMEIIHPSSKEKISFMTQNPY